MPLNKLLNNAIKTIGRIDAECLLAFCLQQSKTFLYTHPEYEPTPLETEQFHTLIQQCKAGWPIAYLTGQRAFYKHHFKVTPDTLIPRPETELLVERVLFHLQNTPNPRILELGTGSGAIALSLAYERPDATIIASDIDPLALQVAKENATLLNLNNVQLIQSDWFAAINGQYDVIVANPPYIAEHSPYLKALRFEPQHALVSGKTGLQALTHIIQQAPTFLRPNSYLCVEHGYDQEAAVQACFKKSNYQAIQTLKDLSGQARVTEGQLKTK